MPLRPWLPIAGAAMLAVAAWWSLRLSELDAVARVGAEKLVLELVVAASFFLAPRQGVDPLLRRLVAGCERHALLALAILLAALYAVAAFTTPQIGWGAGAQGVGYGDDGQAYGWMAEHFAWFRHAAPTPFNFRPLVPFLVHATGLPTFSGYALVNAASHVLSGALVYGIALHFTPRRAVGLLAVALFGMLKFGLKFWVYYPVLTDGVGTFLLLAAVHSTLAGRPLAYLLSMAAAVFCRENVIVLVGFNVLHTVRTGRGVRSPLVALALQAIPIGLLVLSRVAPVFAPMLPDHPLAAMRAFGSTFLFAPDRQARAVYAQVNALGILLVVPLLSLPAAARFVRAEYEWAFYALATLALSLLGGSDLDRFAFWQAPLLVAVLAHLARIGVLPGDGWRWLHVLALHAVAMEFPLGWDPARDFYLARLAAHARGAAFSYLSASCVLTVALASAMLAAGRRPRAQADGAQTADVVPPRAVPAEGVVAGAMPVGPGATD